MKSIRKVWSHLSLEDDEKSSNIDIRRSEPYEVNRFQSLVKRIATISYHNPEWSLFYRGQSSDYKNKLKLTSVYPSIYRSKEGLLINNNSLNDRVSTLTQAEYELLKEFQKNNFDGYTKLQKFRELRWAVLQHYEVCDTPLLDLTHSLRVACSFALKSDNEYGILHVFGLPHSYGSISYFVEDELFNIKLLSICPPKAYRPFFQEGYLVGTFPSNDTERSFKLDMGRRLIAKFKLNKQKFWDAHFTAIPEEALYPNSDPMKKVCERIKSNVERGF